MDHQPIVDILLPYLPNFLWIVLILLCTRIALGSTSQILRIIYKHFNVPKGYYMRARLIVRLMIYVTAFFMILLFIPGIDEKAIAVVGLGIGVIVSLSSTTTIGNAVAGFIIHYTRPIREGDRVEIDGMMGDVVSVELLFVHLKTIKDVIISIPALNVLNNNIINYSTLDRIQVPVSLTLGYDLDPGQVEKLMIKAVEKIEGILDDPKPFVLIRNLNDYTVEYEVNGYTDQPNKLVILKSNIMRNIIIEFTSEGVQIMSPAYIDIMEISESQKIIPEKVSRKVECAEEQDTEKTILDAKKQLSEKKKQKINLDEPKK